MKSGKFIFIHKTIIVTESVSITPTIINATDVQISWNIPSSVSSQGINSFTVALIPQCVSGEQAGETQRYIGNDETVTMISFGNLRELL